MIKRFRWILLVLFALIGAASALTWHRMTQFDLAVTWVSYADGYAQGRLKNTSKRHVDPYVAVLSAEPERAGLVQTAPISTVVSKDGKPFSLEPGDSVQIIVRIDDPALLRHTIATDDHGGKLRVRVSLPVR